MLKSRGQERKRIQSLRRKTCHVKKDLHEEHVSGWDGVAMWNATASNIRTLSQTPGAGVGEQILHPVQPGVFFSLTCSRPFLTAHLLILKLVSPPS